MQSHQEYTPAAYCWCPALEMLSDCHAWKIQSSPDNGGFPVLSSMHRRRDRADMLALPIKNRYVAITMKTSYFCRGYSRPASSWRRQSTGCALGATYKPDIFTLVGPRVFQSAIAHIDTIGDNDPFLITRSLLANTWQNVSKGGDILCRKSATVLLIFGHFLLACTAPDRRQRNRAENNSWR